MPWTKFFRRSADVGGPGINDLLSGLSRLFEGMGEEDVFWVACREVVRIFRCEAAALLWLDPGAAAVGDGEWILRCTGHGVIPLVTQADADNDPEISVGRLLPLSEGLTQRVMLKAIALAFEEGEFYGCDVERDQVVLLRDPGPDDDLGSGDLSLLAIPLAYHHRMGHVLERARVGVLALYGLPVACDLRPLEGFLRSLIGYATTTPSCSLRDPVTGLYTSLQLREELDRYLNTYELTNGKLKGGLVVGKVDGLPFLQQRIEATGRVAPGVVGQVVSDVLRGLGGRLLQMTRNYSLPGLDYRSGIAARLGRDGFGALLPLLNSAQLERWASQLARSIADQRFPGVGAESVTLSLRVIPFGGASGPSTLESAWALAGKSLEQLGAMQTRVAAERPGARDQVGKIQVLTPKGWMAPGRPALE